MARLLFNLEFRIKFRMEMYTSIQIQPLQIQVTLLYRNVNMNEKTNFIGLVTGGSSYTGPTTITGNTGPKKLN